MGRNNLIVCNNEDSFATRGLVRQVVSRLLNAPLLKLCIFFFTQFTPANGVSVDWIHCS